MRRTIIALMLTALAGSALATGFWWNRNAGMGGQDVARTVLFTLEGREVTNATTVVDLSPEGNDGTPNGGMVFTAQGAGVFDGTDDYVGFSSASFTNDAKGSVSAWINPDTIAANSAIMGWGGDSAGHFTLRLQSDDKLRIQVQSGATARNVTTTATVPTGEWTHVAATTGGAGSGTGWKLYINGVDQAVTVGGSNEGWWFADATPGANGVASLGVTKYSGTLSWYLDGSIAEARLYQRTLTADEVAELHASQRKILTDKGVIP